MQKFLLLAMCALGSTTALGDFTPPSVVDPPSQVRITGNEAIDLAFKMMGEWKRGSSLRTTSSRYKVFRSKSGQTQIVCEIWSGADHPLDECTFTQSSDGQPLPEFVPKIRMQPLRALLFGDH